MSSAGKNLEVHGRWADAENRQDLSRLEDFMHSDIEEHLSADDVIVGIDAHRASLEAVYRAFPDFHNVFDDRIATDDRVVCRWRTRGTHEADFFGIPATGSHVEWMGISIWEFEGGRARRGWIMQDTASLMRQLGVRT
jgi:steroid delta-isomerase-like uncharacterized protein